MNKLETLLKDEALVKELLEQETIEDAKKFLSAHGVELSNEEIEKIRSGITAKLNDSEELSDDQLENVAGGVSGDAIALAIDIGVNTVIKLGDAVDRWTRRRW